MQATGTAPADGEILFCHRNNKLWLTVLLTSAAFVLGLAIWLAMGRHDLEGGRLAGAPAGPAPRIAQPAGTPAQPVAMAPSITPIPTQPFASRTTGVPSPFVQVASPVGATTAQQLQSSFNTVAESVRPTVVNINAVRSKPRDLNRPANDAQFVDPFDGIPDKIIGELAFESVGSGVIVDDRGYVVTNQHVVDGAVTIMVTRFNEQEPVRATLLATDRSRDLALLALDGPGPFPAAKLGNSSTVDIGDWVIAVGNPFGLGHTVTAGIVSSRRSAIQIGGVVYDDLLQTDAPINQGSSGGPLVNLHGKVIGINTAIYAPTGVFNGTGFAIPSNQVGAFVSSALAQTDHPAVAPVAAQRVAPAQQGASHSAWLGIEGTTVDADIARKLGLAQPGGVFVNRVVADSPAADSDIERGDVITEVAGHPVADQQALTAVVGALPPGLNASVVTWRNGRLRTQKIKLGLRPQWPPPAQGQPK